MEHFVQRKTGDINTRFCSLPCQQQQFFPYQQYNTVNKMMFINQTYLNLTGTHVAMRLGMIAVKQEKFVCHKKETQLNKFAAVADDELGRGIFTHTYKKNALPISYNNCSRYGHFCAPPLQTTR